VIDLHQGNRVAERLMPPKSQESFGILDCHLFRFQHGPERTGALTQVNDPDFRGAQHVCQNLS
jgi:hypothetical protein